MCGIETFERAEGRALPGRRAGLLAVGVLWLLGCQPNRDLGRDYEPVFDFVAGLATAEVVSEVQGITFDSSEDRRHLLSGWSRSERDAGRGRGFAWGIGEASVVDLPVLEARELELRLEGRAYHYPGAEPQSVTVRVNGHRIDELEMGPGLTVHDVTLPAAALVAGRNRLELAYRWSRSPRAVAQSNDRRSLAVAWYELRLAPGEVASPRAQAGDPPRLFVPFGSEVAYYLELAPGRELRLPRWRARGGKGRVEVLLHPERGEPERLLALVEPGSGATLRLPDDSGRVARLALRATAEGGAVPAAGEGGIVLESPAIWQPAAVSLAPATPTSATPASATPASSGPPGSTGSAPSPDAATERRPNIVLYLIDTLRADHLGCYGYGRPVSPQIDGFAERAVLFEHAVAQSSWTRSSMASIFTGLWPPAHGTNGRSDRLSDAALTLPERLRAAGYRTAAFITNPNLTAGFGFDQGFDEFVYLTEEAKSDEVHRAAADWLASRDGEEPFFLYLHTLDPHSPYTAPASFRRRFAPGVSEETAERSLPILDDLQAGRVPVTEALTAELRALYDAEIAFNDDSFGALVAELTARELFDDALMILASDHGEEFHEHGNWQHGRALHGESIDVPLIVKLPRAAGGRRVRDRVQHVDLLPTLLAYLGLPAEPQLEGRSLLPLLAGGAAPPARVFSYLHLDGPARLSVVDGDWKLIQRLEHGELLVPRLYRPGNDPGERDNLAERHPIRAGYLAGLMQARLAGREAALPSEAAAVDESVRQSLEALGYLD